MYAEEYKWSIYAGNYWLTHSRSITPTKNHYFHRVHPCGYPLPLPLSLSYHNERDNDQHSICGGWGPGGLRAGGLGKLAGQGCIGMR